MLSELCSGFQVSGHIKMFLTVFVFYNLSSVLILIFEVRTDVTIYVTCCNTADLECGLTSNVVFLPSLRSTWPTLMLS